MTTPITKEQLQRIIESADDVLSAQAGTNEDVHPESDDMIRLWDYLNDVAAPPAVVKRLAEIALSAMDAEPVADVVAWHKEGEERTCDIRWRRFDVAPGPLFAVAQPVAVDNTFIPKNLDRALGVVGVALLESKEEFNFQIERWIQRLIDRVIRYAEEFKEQPAPVVDAEPAKYHIGDTTMQNVFKPTGMTDISDLQAVFDQVEIALNSPVIPDGWQLVPVDATEKMLVAGLEEANPLGGLIDWDASRGDCNTREQVRDIFKAIIAAAPQQEVKP